MLNITRLENQLFILLIIFLFEGLLRQLFFSYSNFIIFFKSIFLLYIFFTNPISKKFLIFYFTILIVFVVITLVQLFTLDFFFDNIIVVILTGFHNNFLFIILSYFISKVDFRSFILKIDKVILIYLFIDLIFVSLQLYFKTNSFLTDIETFRSIGVGQTIRPNGLSTSPYGHMMTIILLYSISLISLAFRGIKKRDYINLFMTLILIILSFQRSFLFYFFPIAFLLFGKFRSVKNKGNLQIVFILILLILLFNVPDDFVNRIQNASQNENSILGYLPFHYFDRIIYEIIQPFIVFSPDIFGVIIGSGSNSTFLLEPIFKEQIYELFDSPYGGPFESGLSRHLLDFGYLGYFVIISRYIFSIFLMYKFLLHKNIFHRPIIGSLIPILLISHLSSHNSVIFVCFFMIGLYFNRNLEKN